MTYTVRHFQMKEVDIEGIKIQFKSMTSSHGQLQSKFKNWL